MSKTMLAGIRRVPATTASEFSVGENVVIFGTSRAGLNGRFGKVTAIEDDRVCVASHFAAGTGLTPFVKRFRPRHLLRCVQVLRSSGANPTGMSAVGD